MVGLEKIRWTTVAMDRRSIPFCIRCSQRIVPAGYAVVACIASYYSSRVVE